MPKPTFAAEVASTELKPVGEYNTLRVVCQGSRPMVTQAHPSREIHQEPTLGAIRNQAARIRNQWSKDERLDRQHQALVFQQQLLKLCGLVPSDGLADVITVSR